MVQVGQKSPDFALEGVLDGKFVEVKLSDYLGNWVVLFFYPLDFTFVCPTEIRGFAARLSEFEDLDAQVLGCSVDSKYSHLAWTERELGKLGFPLLSDMTREVTREYGILLEDRGHSLRGTFIVDPEGVLRYAVVHDNNIGRNTDETLRVLQALQTGELCPVDWKPGAPTLGS
jgi:peroxiredoxin (alkyl hydroperoxide reductase subunit C)